MWDTYPDELIYLSREVARRQIDGWIMKLRIANNPNAEPRDQQEFGNSLIDKRRELYGAASNEELDKEGLEDLKKFLKEKHSSIGVQK